MDYLVNGLGWWFLAWAAGFVVPVALFLWVVFRRIFRGKK